jgi:RNA polymerase sigma factor (sigma-70 family)
MQNKRIDNALNALDDRSREVIELKYFAKLSNKQIAIRLGLTEQWVCEIKRRAINSLVASIFMV